MRTRSAHQLTCCLTAVVSGWTAILPAEVLTNQPYRGVTYITRTETFPRPLVMHIAIIELSAPGIRFKLTPPGGTLETVRQRTVDFLTQENAQLAINAHFFLPFPSEEPDANVVGLAASEGIIYSPFEPQPIGPGYVDQSYALLEFAPALNIDPSNKARIVHLDPAYDDHKHVLESVPLWNALSGSAQIITDGIKTIPAYSGSPDGLNPSGFYWEGNSWYSYARGRTSIGLPHDNEWLVLFTVDEAGGSYGMTPGEVADILMQDYQVYNALNLDGGGSTSMALADPVTQFGNLVNISSDSLEGRATGSNLAVFAEPCGVSLAMTITLMPAGRVLISWSAPGRGWHLQETADLHLSQWNNVSTHPDKVGDRMEVSLVLQSLSRFYRLRKDCE